jgi:hypothetical protein
MGEYLVTFESGFTFNVIEIQSALDFNLVSTTKVHPARNNAIHSYKIYIYMEQHAK